MNLIERMKWERLIGGAGGISVEGIAIGDEPKGKIAFEAEQIKQYAFFSCKEITSVYAPNLMNIPRSAFEYCGKLTEIDAPNVKTVAMGGTSHTAIKKLNFPKLTVLTYSCFANMLELEGFDASDKVALMEGACFDAAISLKRLILRNPNGVTMANTNALRGTPFASGGSGGEIYIPQALLDSGWYTTATNWSVMNEYGTITWKAIEGSEYE